MYYAVYWGKTVNQGKIFIDLPHKNGIWRKEKGMVNQGKL